YQRSQRLSHIVESLAQGSRDVEQMSRLLEGPVSPWTGERAEELPPNSKADPKGFLILQDLRIIDLRQWKAGRNNADTRLYGYRRLKVQKQPDNLNNHRFRVTVLAISSETQVRFPAQQLKPRLYSHVLDSSTSDEKLMHWEVGADFRKVPAGESADLVYEH